MNVHTYTRMCKCPCGLLLHAHLYTLIHNCTHLHTQVYAYTRRYTLTHECINVRQMSNCIVAHSYMHICTHLHTQVHIYTRMYTLTHTCTHLHTHVSTYTHMYTQTSVFLPPHSCSAIILVSSYSFSVGSYSFIPLFLSWNINRELFSSGPHQCKEGQR